MTEANRTRANGPALEKMYQFMLWLVPTVNKMPRSQKFTLGDRIQNTALELDLSSDEFLNNRSINRAPT